MVVAQTTGFDSVLSVGNANATKNTNSKTKSQDDSDFGSLLNLKATSNIDASGNKSLTVKNRTSSVDGIKGSSESTNDTAKAASKVDNSKDTIKDDKNISKDDTSTAREAAADKKVSDTTDKNKSMDIEDKDTDISKLEDIVNSDSFKDAINELKSTIMDMLDIDEEQLENLLSSMGINISSLLEPEQLKNFVLQATNSTPVDLVTNEGLSNLLKSVTSAVEDIKGKLPEEDVQMVIEKGNVVKDMLGEPNTLKNSKPITQDIVVEDKNLAKANTSKIKVSVEDSRASSTDSQIDHKAANTYSEQDIANTVVNNIKDAVTNVDKFTTKISASEVNTADIISQIVEQVKVSIKSDSSTMELQLYPEHLGKLQISLASKGGIVTASIVAENELAKAAIENSINTLKESFVNQDIKVEAVEVSVSTAAFSQNQDRQTGESQEGRQGGKRRINLGDLLEDEELSEEEELELQMMKEEGRSVSYQV